MWRGTLAGAVEHAADTAARGEHVIVLGPAPPAPVADDDTLDAFLDRLLADGRSTRDAATLAAAELGVARRRAYEAATRIQGVARGTGR